jgi:hypothetical protein
VAFLLGSKSGARISRYERFHQAPNLKSLLAYELLFRTPIRELYSGLSDEVEDDLKERGRVLLRKLAKAEPDQVSSHKLNILRALLDGEDQAYQAI